MKVNIALNLSVLREFYEVLRSESIVDKAHNSKQRFIHVINALIYINSTAVLIWKTDL
jgi:hypothetical protein